MSYCKERDTEELFNIEIMSFDEFDMAEEGYLYTNIEWYLHELKKYNGMSAVVNLNWDIEIWNNEGAKLDKINILSLASFQNLLKNRISPTNIGEL